MRSALPLFIAMIAGYGVAFIRPGTSVADQPALATPAIQAYFSPRGGCTDAIVAELGQAKSTIDVQAYSFTSAPIAKAVVDAKDRGVKVRVILDKGQDTQKYSSVTFLRNAGVDTKLDRKHAIAHNKIMIIDGKTLLTGSFNFTQAAEKSNAENLLVIRDNPDLLAAYQKNFQTHLEHSEE